MVYIYSQGQRLRFVRSDYRERVRVERYTHTYTNVYICISQSVVSQTTWQLRVTLSALCFFLFLSFALAFPSLLLLLDFAYLSYAINMNLALLSVYTRAQAKRNKTQRWSRMRMGSLYDFFRGFRVRERATPLLHYFAISWYAMGVYIYGAVWVAFRFFSLIKCGTFISGL